MQPLRARWTASPRKADTTLPALAPHSTAAHSLLAAPSLCGVRWYLPSSTPSYVVSSFLKHIQPRALRGSAKEYVTAFARYYFSRRPELSPADIRALLLGDEERRGLLESCGAVKGLTAGGGAGQLRSSSLLCLELTLMLLDTNVNVQHADAFLDALVGAAASGQLSPRLLQSMRLSLHIERAQAAGNNTQLEYAYKLLFILESAVPALKRAEWVGSQQAVGAFEQWQSARLAELAEQQRQAVVEVEDDDRVLSSWADVRLADLEAEESAQEAALAELIADVDAEAEAEGGQKDPLGILQKPIAATTATAAAGGAAQKQAAGADIRTPARLGAAAAAQMKALWRQASGGQHKAVGAAEQSKNGAGGGDTQAGGDSLRDVLSAAQLSSGGSISADSYNFNPVLFLSTAHSQTSLEQLQRGLSHLQRSVNNRAAALKSLVADHYGQYVFCLDTIEHLEAVMAAEVGDKGSSRAQRIRSQLQQLNAHCADAYDAILERKAGGERMRLTLHTMTQYRFLFALPGEVAHFASTRQFAQVVRAYKKAKAISSTAPNTAAAHAAEDGRRDNGVKVSKAAGELPSLVLAEVFRLVSGVRATLFRQLDTAGVAEDEQADAIAHLRELDADIDPAWYFLHRQAANTNQRITQAVLDFAAQLHHARANSAHFAEHSGQRHGEAELDGQLAAPEDGPSAAPSATSALSSHVSTLPWNRFGAALLANPVFASTLPSPPSYAAEWERALPASVRLSSSVDEWSASLLPALAGRLCDVVSSGVPELLSLARLATSAQPTAAPDTYGSGASTQAAALRHSSSASQFGSSPPPTQSNSSVAAILSSMPDSSRRGVESLLHSVVEHFAAHVRLVVFPLSLAAAQQWPSEKAYPGASPPLGVGDRLPRATPAPSASTSTQSPNASAQRQAATVDKRSEHQPFSLDDMHDMRAALPRVQPTDSDARLPLPRFFSAVVRQLLQLHSQLADSALPSSVLAPFSELRRELMRSFVQQHVRNVQLDVRALPALEEWQLSSPSQIGHSSTRRRSATTRRERRGSTRRSASPTAEADSAASSDCSSLRITGLPFRFSALFESALDSLRAIPSFKAVWLIKLVAGPLMDAMRAFATAQHSLANQTAQQADEPLSDGVPAALRLLLVLANVRYTRLQLLPPLLASLLALFPHSTHELLRTAYQQSVLPAYEESETAALHHFIRLQLAHMHQHIAYRAYSHAALSEQIHAHNSRVHAHSGRLAASAAVAAPPRTRGCVVAACFHLVAVHAQLFLVCGHAADEVTRRAMQALLTGSTHAITAALQQLEAAVSEAGADGTARLACLVPLLEVEAAFVHSVLAAFSTGDSEAARRELEALLSGWQHAAGGRVSQQADKAALLSADLARTQLMFAAFQRPDGSAAQQHNGHAHSSAKQRRGLGSRQQADGGGVARKLRQAEEEAKAKGEGSSSQDDSGEEDEDEDEEDEPELLDGDYDD